MRRSLPIFMLACFSCATPAHPPLPAPDEPLVLTPDATFRATPPPAGMPHPWVIPEPEVSRLPNGLTVLLVRLPEASEIAVDFAAHGAGEIGAPATAGLADLVGTMIADDDNGPTTAAITEEHGLQFRPRVSRDGADFLLKTSPAGLPESLERLARTLTRPTFRPATLERLRLQSMNTVIRTAASPVQVAANLMRRRLYGEAHPLATPVEGLQHVINEITLDEVAQFHDDRFRPSESALILAGDIDRRQLLPLVTQAFGRWTNETPPPPPEAAPPIDPSGHQVALVYWYGLPDSLVLLGCRGVAREASAYPALLVIANLLGGRLGPHGTLRESRGSAPASRAWIDTAGAGTTLLAAADVKPGEEGATADAMLKALGTLGTALVSPEELAVAKATLAESIGNAYQTAPDVAATVGALFAAGQPAKTEAKLVARVEALTAGDVLLVAHDFLQQKDARIVVVADPRAALPALTQAGFKEIDGFRPGG